MSQKKITEIRSLYERATAGTVQRDLQRAVNILKSLPDEETRRRAAVFMDGLSQLRSEWLLENKRKQNKTPQSTPPRRRAARRTKKRSAK